MNPYEAPQTGAESTPEQRRHSKTVALGLILAAFLIVGGMATLSRVRFEKARAMKEAMMRAEQAAQAEATSTRKDY